MFLGPIASLPPLRLMPRRSPGLFLLTVALGTVLAGGCGEIPGTGPSAGPVADTTRAPGVPPPGEGLVTGTTGRSVAAVTEQLSELTEAVERQNELIEKQHRALQRLL